MSGYFAAYTLNKKYFKLPSGTAKFYINRLIKIFSNYYLALIISFLILLIISDNFILHYSYGLPTTVLSWLKNIFIVGLGPITGYERADVRLVPTAWFFSNMLFFYALAPVLCKKHFNTSAWFLLSLLVCVYLLFSHASFDVRYFPLYSASLPLSLGSLLYYLNKKNKFKKIITNKIFFYFSFFAFIPNIFIAKYFDQNYVFSIYLNIFLLFVLIANLLNLKTDSVHGTYKRADRYLHKLTIPLFLLHWQTTGLLLFIIFRDNIPSLGLFSKTMLFFTSVVFVNIVSVFFVQASDKLLNIKNLFSKTH